MAKLTRRESREIAFALLFEWSFQHTGLDEMLELAELARDVKVDEFAHSLVQKVIESHEELDALIEQYSQGWKLSRISRTVLSVLRMSFCELTKFGDIPVGASINEAVELVKKYGTDEEAGYLNGILGNFEQVRKGLKKAPPLPMPKVDDEITDTDSEDTEDTHKQKEQNIQKRHTDKKGEPEILEDIIIEVE